MTIFNGFFEKNSNNSHNLGLLKLHSIDSMYAEQVDFFSFLDRVHASGVIDEDNLLKNKVDVNLKRQSLQDTFLIGNDSDVELLSKKAQSSLHNLIEIQKKNLLLMEKEIPLSQRANSISHYFEKKFANLFKENKLNQNDMEQIKSQVKIYKAGLKRSFENTEIRSELKNDLLHDLLNDFYFDMFRLYSKFG